MSHLPKALLLLIAISLALLFPWNWLNYQMLTPSEKFAQAWYQDLQLLKEQEKLPKSWSQIRSVEYLPSELKTEIWDLKAYAPVALNAKGDRRLEVLLLPWVREGEYGVTITYHLLEAENKNTVWEFGRTFRLGSASELKP